MTEIYTQEKVKQDGRNENNGKQSMLKLAEREVRHHTTPSPDAQEPAIDPFPRPVNGGLWLSILISGLLGLGFGVLLQNNLLVIPGWEGLYSLAPFTFHACWTLMGVALGILIGGVATLVVTSPRHVSVEDPE